MLEINNLHVSYGGIQALQGISLHVPEGKIISLLGANGAGKSTTLRTIMGIVKPTEGKIIFQGESLLGLKSYQVVMKGIALVPEGRRVFTNLTVTENLALGAYTRNDKYQIQRDIDEVYELFPRLKEREKQSAGTLSGGEQQMLAVGRALVLNPTLLLLDEPLEGLAPIIVQELLRAIRRITREEGLSAIIVEQHPQAILAISDTAAVLDRGTVVHAGTAASLREQPELLDRLLGVAR